MPAAPWHLKLSTGFWLIEASGEAEDQEPQSQIAFGFRPFGTHQYSDSMVGSNVKNRSCPRKVALQPRAGFAYPNPFSSHGCQEHVMVTF